MKTPSLLHYIRIIERRMQRKEERVVTAVPSERHIVSHETPTRTASRNERTVDAFAAIRCKCSSFLVRPLKGCCAVRVHTVRLPRSRLAFY